MDNVHLINLPIEGDAIATHNGRVIWTNHESGDCPPDIIMMIVKNIYIIDGEFVIELKYEGEE